MIKTTSALLLLLRVLTLGVLAAAAGGAHATQCIWNKGGFVLNAKWYNPADVVPTIVTMPPEAGKPETKKVVMGLRENAKSLQEDQWPVMQGRCTRGENANKTLTAVLSVVGGKFGSDAIKWIAGASATVLGTAVGGAAGIGCSVATAGLACPFVVAGIAGYTLAADLAISQIPDGAGVFYIGEPSTTEACPNMTDGCYLDVWGTIWSPQTGPGGSTGFGKVQPAPKTMTSAPIIPFTRGGKDNYEIEKLRIEKASKTK